MYCKIKPLLCVVFLHLFVNGFRQQQYSIDKRSLKRSGRLSAKEYLYYRKIAKVEKKQASKMKIMDKKTDKLAKKYAKTKQTKKVQKRMKESRKMADKFNKGKPQVSDYLMFKYKMKRLYGRDF